MKIFLNNNLIVKENFLINSSADLKNYLVNFIVNNFLKIKKLVSKKIILDDLLRLVVETNFQNNLKNLCLNFEKYNFKLNIKNI